MDHLKEIQTRLQNITRDCRPDMHEPDEQELKARVVGDHLDNAMGTEIIPELLEKGAHEYVVVLERLTPKGFEVEKFSLADLIALAR